VFQRVATHASKHVWPSEILCYSGRFSPFSNQNKTHKLTAVSEHKREKEYSVPSPFSFISLSQIKNIISAPILYLSSSISEQTSLQLGYVLQFCFLQDLVSGFCYRWVTSEFPFQMKEIILKF
jgi:hypothetical protein